MTKTLKENNYHRTTNLAISFKEEVKNTNMKKEKRSKSKNLSILVVKNIIASIFIKILNYFLKCILF